MKQILRMERVFKEYHGVAVLKDMTFDLHEAEIHSLVGENGAGKSTLTKIIAGVTSQTSGTMWLGDDILSLRSPAEALDRGIAMVFQETSLVPSMTVAQNLFLGHEKNFNRLRGLYISAQQFLQSLNFNVDPWTKVSALGAAKRQMVEIARAVRFNAKIIIFDEPTATLTQEEKHHFFALVQRLKLSGVTVVFISHALEEALAISDRITVLRDGELVITDKAANFTRDSLIRAMVGRSLSDDLYAAKKVARAGGKKVLSVQNLSMGGAVRNNSFSVYEGQVTGVFGLIGSGRTETAKVIAGALKRNFFHGGQIKFNNRPVRYRVPRAAVSDGIIYVTEDRKIEGFFETMSIAENIYYGEMASRLWKNMVVNLSEMRLLADHWRKTLDVRASNREARVIELSGGNQQKVVIAAALAQRPKLIIFDEPTRGVDVGAIADIHALINRLADEGLPIVVISSYLPEIMTLSDRILVCRAGKVVEEFGPSEANEDLIMYSAVH